MNFEKQPQPETKTPDENNPTRSGSRLEKIKFDPDKANQLKLEAAGDSFGPGREDKNVTIVTNGKEKRTSSIMLGKNEAGYNLDDDTYINEEDAQKTFSDALYEAGDNAKIVRMEPPAELSPEEASSEIISNINQEHSSITISENEKIQGQDALNAEVNIPGTEEKDLKGVLMLGKEKIDFADGEYISEKAFKEAIDNYMVSTPESTEKPSEKVAYISPEAQGSAKFSIGERAKKAAAIFALATVLFLSTAASINNGQAERPSLDKTINPHPIETIEERIDDTQEIENRLQGVNIGDVYEIPDGVKVHESSDYQNGGANEIGTIGNEVLPDQDNTIQGFSILDPETHTVIADNVTWKPGTNLGEYQEEISKKTGVPLEKIKAETKIHVGHENSSAGWVDYNDIVNQSVEKQ